MAKKDEIKAGDIHALLTAGSYEAFPTLQRWLAEGVIDKEALNRPFPPRTPLRSHQWKPAEDSC